MARRRTRKRVRRTRRYRGRGGYWGELGNAVLTGGGAGLGGLIGTAGGPLSAVGASVGGMAGHKLANVLGMGAYAVNRNSLTGVDEGNAVPGFGNMSQGTRVQHREYVGDIIATGSNNFSVTAFPLNPGISGSFPWLANLAINYQQYEWMGMIWEFISTCSDDTGGASMGMGTVIMATDYDAVDVDFTSKLAMENSQYCISAKPSSNQCHIIECAPHRSADTIKYVRSGAPGPNQDLRFMDHGNFQIALSGTAAASAGTVLGELWCTYDVVLYKPQLTGGLVGGNILFDHVKLTTTQASTITSTNHFGTSGTLVTDGTMGGTFSSNAYSFPEEITQGQFLVVYSVFGTATLLTNDADLPSVANGTIAFVDAYQLRNPGATTNALWFIEFLVGPVAPGSLRCTMTWNTGDTMPASPTDGMFLVTQVASSGVLN